MIDPKGRTPVVIPTLNEAAHIAGVIRALDDPTAPGGGYHFIVADGGSTDGTAEAALATVAEGHRVEVLPNPKRLQSAAVNLVVSQLAPGVEVFVRCDAHGGYPPSFLSRLLESLERESASSVVVSMDSVGETCMQKAVAWVSNTPVGTGGSAHRAGAKSGWVDHGHHAAFRVASFRDVGGYDERLVANEDAELDARLRAAGGRIWLDAEVRMAYYPRRSLGALARQYYRYGFGRAFTALKHPKTLKPRQFAVPANLLLVLASLAVAPWLPLALAWPAFYLSVLALTSLALALRHRSACGLLAGPAALVMHTAWAVGFLHRMAGAAFSRA